MKDISQNTHGLPTQEMILEILYEVLDPDLNCPIVDMGLVYEIEITPDLLRVTYTLTSPFCPAGDQIHEDILAVLRAGTDYQNIQAELVWVPAWGPERMSEELRLSMGLPI